MDLEIRRALTTLQRAGVEVGIPLPSMEVAEFKIHWGRVLRQWLSQKFQIECDFLEMGPLDLKSGQFIHSHLKLAEENALSKIFKQKHLLDPLQLTIQYKHNLGQANSVKVEELNIVAQCLSEFNFIYLYETIPALVKDESLTYSILFYQYPHSIIQEAPISTWSRILYVFRETTSQEMAKREEKYKKRIESQAKAKNKKENKEKRMLNLLLEKYGPPSQTEKTSEE